MLPQLSDDKKMVIDRFKSINQFVDNQSGESKEQLTVMFINALQQIQNLENDRKKEAFIWRIKEEFIQLRREVNSIMKQIEELKSQFDSIIDASTKIDNRCQESIVNILSFDFQFPYQKPT